MQRMRLSPIHARKRKALLAPLPAAANDALQKAEASGRHIRTKIVTLKDRLDVGQPVQPAHPGRKQMNQSRSEYVVAITWREKQISTLLCDRIHDDYIAAIPLEEAEQIAADLWIARW